MKFDAVVFDMDGVLVDVSHSYDEAIVRTADELLQSAGCVKRVSPAERDVVKAIAGFNNDWDAVFALVQNHAEARRLQPLSPFERGSALYLRVKRVFERYYWNGGEGFIAREKPLASNAALEALSRFKLGIVTGRPRREALFAVAKFGWSRFFPPAAIVALEDCAFEKPRPEPILECLKRLGASRAVYAGDSVNDELAARAAGCEFFKVSAARSVNELPAFVRALENA